MTEIPAQTQSLSGPGPYRFTSVTVWNEVARLPCQAAKELSRRLTCHNVGSSVNLDYVVALIAEAQLPAGIVGLPITFLNPTSQHAAYLSTCILLEPGPCPGPGEGFGIPIVRIALQGSPQLDATA